ncbi:hypothetical protein L1987_43273 [Smallanthus sonchifolius]|uniref:Uncharacterized protein n=1 Tax=Smallanthus sonchifolius TaxID=185202 RepID=A0ACB9GKM2_9ASTR|nr:hypothetical protein L1987_43273 [Smallanthus sonchifolius]
MCFPQNGLWACQPIKLAEMFWEFYNCHLVVIQCICTSLGFEWYFGDLPLRIPLIQLSNEANGREAPPVSLKKNVHGEVQALCVGQRSSNECRATPAPSLYICMDPHDPDVCLGLLTLGVLSHLVLLTHLEFPFVWVQILVRVQSVVIPISVTDDRCRRSPSSARNSIF